MQMPHNGFDSLAALARLNTDDTSHHRERWPSLDWVWDELDELRADAAEAVRLLLEPEPDMDRVQALLMGGR